VASVDDLANVPLFRDLGPDDLAKVADWFHVQHAGEGVRLVAEMVQTRAAELAELA
jgi:hypothetical protein